MYNDGIIHERWLLLYDMKYAVTLLLHHLLFVVTKTLASLDNTCKSLCHGASLF